MKSILKYGIIGGIILAAGLNFLSIHYFPDFVLTIILFPGGMMFAVNDHIKNEVKRKSYSYIKGVGIGLGFAFLSLVLCHLIWWAIRWNFSFQAIWLSFSGLSIKYFPLVLCAAFGVPLMYVRNEKPREEDKRKLRSDILDEEL